MVVPNQDNPFGSRLAMPGRFAGTTLNNPDSRLSLSKSVSTRIGGVSQHLQQCVVDWNGTFQTILRSPGSLGKAGSDTSSCRNHNSTCRTLPSSVIFVKTN